MDGEGERTAWNRALLAQMGAPPTKAQVLTEIDFEIGDAIQLAAASNFPTLVRPAANGPTRSGPNPAPTRVEGSGRPLDRLEFQAYWTECCHTTAQRTRQHEGGLPAVCRSREQQMRSGKVRGAGHAGYRGGARDMVTVG
jgi:hypothetical protein